jgi:hypothetical protein
MSNTLKSSGGMMD